MWGKHSTISICVITSLLWSRIDLMKVFKETLQLMIILRKILEMRFFPWLSVFFLHRWKYKLSENNTILKLKITVLTQKLMIFCGLVDKYYCLLLSLLGHMRSKRKHYQHGLQRENERFADQEILQTLLGKGLKECEI